MARMARRRTWLGGRIHYGRDGKPHFYLWRKRAGKRYRFTLGVHTEEAALREYKRWELDPDGYVPPTQRDPVDEAAPVLDSDTIKRFLTWSARPVEQGGKGNSRDWVGQQRIHLTWWLKTLGNVDLRRLSAAKILDTAEGISARAHKLRVLSAFYSWLEKRQQSIEVNPFAKITLPQPEPSDASRALSYDDVLAVFEALCNPPRRGAKLPSRTDHWACGFMIQMATGWHSTEIRRFAESGWIEPPPDDDCAAVLVTVHKSKRLHKTRVAPATLSAAEQLKERTARAHGHTFDVKRYREAVKRACEHANVPMFTPRLLRHSVTAWAIDRGDSLERIAEFHGHATKVTTDRFYAKYRAKAKIASPTDALEPRRLLKGGKS